MVHRYFATSLGALCLAILAVAWRRKQALREEILRAKPTTSEIRERYKAMDERLANIEKIVTSRRYQIDEELRRL